MKTLKYSRQRAAIKECLMNRKDHPTADMVYIDIQKEYPNISLGTVYRNLNLLVELGEVARLVCDGRNDRFDGDIKPHYHFICHSCGSVSDLPMALLHDVERLASVHTEGRVDGHTMLFYGLCRDCLQKQEIEKNS